jgi:CO/xanthine dehydrogenase Mo-binding subunit
VVVSIVEIGSPTGGMGEPGVPPLAPALANALFGAAPASRTDAQPDDPAAPSTDDPVTSRGATG